LSESTRLSQVVAEILRLPVHSVSDGLTLATTENWDSLTHMELIAAIEQEFAIELSVDDIVAMVSYAAIRSILGGKGVVV
jgi:acyl carrier protein